MPSGMDDTDNIFWRYPFPDSNESSNDSQDDQTDQNQSPNIREAERADEPPKEFSLSDIDPQLLQCSGTEVPEVSPEVGTDVTGQLEEEQMNSGKQDLSGDKSSTIYGNPERHSPQTQTTPEDEDFHPLDEEIVHTWIDPRIMEIDRTQKREVFKLKGAKKEMEDLAKFQDFNRMQKVAGYVIDFPKEFEDIWESGHRPFMFAKWIRLSVSADIPEGTKEVVLTVNSLREWNDAMIHTAELMDRMEDLTCLNLNLMELDQFALLGPCLAHLKKLTTLYFFLSHGHSEQQEFVLENDRTLPELKKLVIAPRVAAWSVQKASLRAGLGTSSSNEDSEKRSRTLQEACEAFLLQVRCPQLEELYVRWYSLDAASLRAVGSKNLKVLDIALFDEFPFAILDEAFKDTEVRLDSLRCVTDIVISTSPLQRLANEWNKFDCLSQLRFLSLGDPSLSETDIQVILRATDSHLKGLILKADLSLFSQDFFHSLAESCPNLEYLILHSIDEQTCAKLALAIGDWKLKFPLTFMCVQLPRLSLANKLLDANTPLKFKHLYLVCTEIPEPVARQFSGKVPHCHVRSIKYCPSAFVKSMMH